MLGSAAAMSSDGQAKRAQRSPRREQIIERAVALMREKGYLGTSIQDMADELDFTKAAFYYFVKNKEELLYTIFQRAMDVSLEGMSEMAQSDAAASQKLHRMIEGLSRHSQSRARPVCDFVPGAATPVARASGGNRRNTAADPGLLEGGVCSGCGVGRSSRISTRRSPRKPWSACARGRIAGSTRAGG